MPARTHGEGSHNASPAGAHHSVAFANATVNAFLGTRQPSWMTGGTKSTSRPVPRRQPTAPAVQPQLPAQTVLPSPAPSDEPSPAVSNPLDSPNPQPASLIDTQNMVSSGNSRMPSFPNTDAHFVHDLTIDTSPSDVQESSRTRNNGSSSTPTTQTYSFFTASRQLQTPVQTGAITPTSTVPSTHLLTAESGPSTTDVVSQSIQAQSPRLAETQSPMLAQGGPALKRRRTDCAPIKTFSSYLALIERYIQLQGGDAAFKRDIERPRIQLLKDACRKEDAIFLVLHQLFCMWAESPQTVHRLLQRPAGVIDEAFGIIETVLKQNQLLSAPHRLWFAQFPVPITNSTAAYLTLDQVATFLEKLSKHFDKLRQISLSRRYPYLVDELLFCLSCYSPVMQTILFTASRRRLGVPDGILGAQMEEAFLRDQMEHWNSALGTQVLKGITAMGEIERENSHLIDYYKLIVAQAPRPQYTQPGSRPQRSVSYNHAATTQGGTSYQIAGPLQSPNTSITPPPLPASQFPSQSLPTSPMVATSPQLGPLVSPQFISTNGAPSYQPSMSFVGQGGQQNSALSEELARHSQQILQQQYQQQQRYQQQQMQQMQQQQQLIQQQRSQLQQRNYPPNTQLVQQYQQQPVLQHPAYQMSQQLNSGSLLNTIQPQPHYQTAPPLQRQPSLAQLQAPQTGLGLPSLSIGHNGSSSPAFAVNNGASSSPRALQAGQASVQHIRRHPSPRLLPPRGHAITRPEMPYDSTEKKAVLMSLHQAHVRSPKRVTKNGGTERYYQAVKSFPVAPTLVIPKACVKEFRFEVTEEQFSIISATRKRNSELLPVVEHFNGSLRWRLRWCESPSKDKTLTDDQWLALDMSWPSTVFMQFNKQALDIRRRSHNGKDLPTELTNMIVPGWNILQVALPDSKRENVGSQFLAVEMLETLSHSHVVQMVWDQGVLPEMQTLQTIKKRLTGPTDDDGIFIVADDLAVDLADPFSAVIFKIPARGAACTHIECFDLENWLETRPSKPPAKCPHTHVACDCKTVPEPSNPDKWRCPIAGCTKDARPYSLRIDNFLLKVRSRLEQENQLQTKSMHVRADGSWSVVLEENDDFDSDEDDGAHLAKKSGSVAPAAKKPEVEVIELD
ncbi:hypothetical protein B0H66DRAFT_529913 [Apodospora peruviana]|uniref:SP-RING-type domain-containing protein n=1 Tax=Apodospora peruviana TaxID=516989 RepID=A0AAE0IIW7_9PEZI|nr:hypothetical protein B0H66DRAFT_529913 [Apodospora peruviana]